VKSLRPSIFWNVGEDGETTSQGGTKETSRPLLLRYYSVFNLSQAEGIDIPASLLHETRTKDPIETCEQIVASMPNPPVFEESDKAWYSPSNDAVGMPARDLFHSSEEYYATEFHELAHSTGHPKRLHRHGFDNPTFFGSESYSKEELVAEMTAAMLSRIAGIEQRTLENSAAYLKTWIVRLKSDSRLLISGASQAQKARTSSKARPCTGRRKHRLLKRKMTDPQVFEDMGIAFNAHMATRGAKSRRKQESAKNCTADCF
jgi:antirestriction protein ArdC